MPLLNQSVIKQLKLKLKLMPLRHFWPLRHQRLMKIARVASPSVHWLSENVFMWVFLLIAKRLRAVKLMAFYLFHSFITWYVH